MPLTHGFFHCAAMSAVIAGVSLPVTAEPVPRMLPGELSADEVLDGAYPFPPSPAVAVRDDSEGFASERVSNPPAPGVHPRILVSPEDLPDLRRRLAETNAGRELYANLKSRADKWLRDPSLWSSRLYASLAAGDRAGAAALISEHHGMPPDIGHYQPWIYAIVMEAFDATVSQDKAKGSRAATAIATYSEIIRPDLEKMLAAPLNDDVWRARISGPVTGTAVSNQGMRDVVGGHLLGYAYDFAFNFMTDDQRAVTRKVIASATRGRLWMGARLPHHFRNWNWIAAGLQQPLLALAIEGEDGYDPRVYQLGVAIARDYLNYAISPAGRSTEAVGYTQFGLVWGDPFFVAATRRGDNLLTHSHHRAMLDWYLQSLEPGLDHFTSHGDGGDRPPAVWTLAMWHYFFPRDPKADFLWQCYCKGTWQCRSDEEPPPFEGDIHIIEPLLWANDMNTDASREPVDYAGGAALGLPTLSLDPARGSLNARSSWNRDAAAVQFECRVDSVGGSHEHADRGNFTFYALGRPWAKDNFRSVETRHHNGILIDGMGQGFWPGPGKWLGRQENGDIVIASADAADAYNWWWPKEILTEPDDFLRFKYPRWESYREPASELRKAFAGQAMERDPRPSVVSFWQGFSKTDPRLWDEDAWPVRLPWNPVRRAFRSMVFHRGGNPWLLIVDDIQKDDRERLYEWLMQTGLDTEVVSLNGNDIILGDATMPRDADGTPRPRKGDRQLLVRVLEANDPADTRPYSSKPSFRLETFERRDTLERENKTGALSGSRSFGIDKRLVIASRSVAPDFKILLFPFRHGDPLPTTEWTGDFTRLSITAEDEATNLKLERIAGRTVLKAE